MKHWFTYPYLLTFVLLLSGSSLSFATPANSWAAHPLSFVENKGQITDQFGQARRDIGYKLAASGGINVFIAPGAIHYQFAQPDAPLTPNAVKGDKTHERNRACTMYRMDVELIGANLNAVAMASDRQDYYERYYTPSVPAEGVVASAFNKVTYHNVYPHIDWVVYTTGGKLKHEFHIHNGGKVSDIRLKYGGQSALSVTATGLLVAQTPMGTITEDAPVSYQADGTKIASSFVLAGDQLTYQVADYSGELVIDPGLGWATYYGGTGDDWALAVATDASGNVYMDGPVSSTSSIATTGAYQTTLIGSEDCMVGAFSPSGIPRWATYYGGSGDEEAYSIALDASANIYFTGWTTSTSGIATFGTHQSTYGGGRWDGFMVKLTASGTRAWGTYFGGTGDEEAWSVALDNTGGVYVTGNTNSTSGIATTGAWLTSFAGYYDAFLARFTTSGTLSWSTYFGGSGDEYGSFVAADRFGNVYIDGYTASTSGIGTSGSFMSTFAGGSQYDAFLAHFNSAGSLQWGTYYGGTLEDRAYGLGVDSAGAIYMGGFTNSSAGIASSGSWQPTYAGARDAFLTKFDSSGARRWGTYYGGTGYDPAQYVFVDDTANVFLSGRTNSPSGIASGGAVQSYFAGGTCDAFFVKFDSAGNRRYATYYGGPGNDFGNAVTSDHSGVVYIAGLTNGTTGIATSGAWQPTYGGGASDQILVQFKTCNLIDAGTITGPANICVGATGTFTATVPGGAWSLTNANATLIAPGTIQTTNPGLDTIFYTFTNACGSSSAPWALEIDTLPNVFAIVGSSTVLAGASTLLTDSLSGGTWSSGNAAIATVSPTGLVTGVAGGTTTITYSVTNSFGCSGFATRSITVIPKVAIADPLAAPSELTIYPNPSTGHFYVDFNNAAGISNNITVTDITGRLLFRADLVTPTQNGIAEIVLPDWFSGWCIVSMGTATDKRAKLHFIHK